MKKITKCKQCNKVFSYETSSTRGKYCNNRCQATHIFLNITSKRFNAGEISERKTIKKCLVYLYGDKCTVCGSSNVWNGNPLVMEVDHVDGISDNNSPTNLRLICPNCHSQQPTSKARNRKNTKRNNYLRIYKKKMVGNNGIEPLNEVCKTSGLPLA